MWIISYLNYIADNFIIYCNKTSASGMSSSKTICFIWNFRKLQEFTVLLISCANKPDFNYTKQIIELYLRKKIPSECEGQ